MCIATPLIHEVCPRPAEFATRSRISGRNHALQGAGRGSWGGGKFDHPVLRQARAIRATSVLYNRLCRSGRRDQRPDASGLQYLADTGPSPELVYSNYSSARKAAGSVLIACAQPRRPPEGGQLQVDNCDFKKDRPAGPLRRSGAAHRERRVHHYLAAHLPTPDNVSLKIRALAEIAGRRSVRARVRAPDFRGWRQFSRRAADGASGR